MQKNCQNFLLLSVSIQLQNLPVTGQHKESTQLFVYIFRKMAKSHDITKLISLSFTHLIKNVPFIFLVFQNC